MVCKIYIFGLLCTASMAAAQQHSAAQMMERFSAKMQEPAAVEMRFSLLGADARGVALTPIEGRIYRQGADYVMYHAEVEVYVHGETKWIYSPDINEAVVMYHDPTSVDLVDNPLALFSAQLPLAHKLSGIPKSFVDKGAEIIELTILPEAKNAAYTSVLLRFYHRTLAPHSVKYLSKDGSWFEALITAYTEKKEPYPPEFFVFQKTKYPGVFISDVR